MLYPDEAVARFLGRTFKDVAANRGKAALDIGCGSGRHTAALSDYGFDALGIDYSPDVVRANNAYYAGRRAGLRFSTEDLSAVGDHGGSFHAVLAYGVAFLRTIDQMKRDFQAIRKCMAPDARALVNFRTPDNWFARLGTEVSPCTYRLDARAEEYEGITYTFLSEVQAHDLLQEAGLTVYAHERVEYWKRNSSQRNAWWIAYVEKAKP